jgi:hypothetical protein
VLRHANPGLLLGALAAQTGWLWLYVRFYQSVLRAMGTRPPC